MGKLISSQKAHAPGPLFLSPEEERLRRRRSNALGLTLAALALVFFLVSILKMSAQLLPFNL